MIGQEIGCTVVGYCYNVLDSALIFSPFHSLLLKLHISCSGGEWDKPFVQNELKLLLKLFWRSCLKWQFGAMWAHCNCYGNLDRVMSVFFHFAVLPRLLWNHDYWRRGSSSCVHVGWYQTWWQICCHNGVRHSYGGMNAIGCWQCIPILLIMSQTSKNKFLPNSTILPIQQQKNSFINTVCLPMNKY